MPIDASSRRVHTAPMLPLRCMTTWPLQVLLYLVRMILLVNVSSIGALAVAVKLRLARRFEDYLLGRLKIVEQAQPWAGASTLLSDSRVSVCVCPRCRMIRC